jgi:hypothetical protein
MAPRKFVNPETESVVLDEVALSIDMIVLSEDAHVRTSKLHSGTVRQDRKEATPEEIAAEKLDKILRRSLRCTAIGAADVDNAPVNI